MKDKIEEILNKYGSWEMLENIKVDKNGTLRVEKGAGYDAKKSCIESLSTLIQEEREEAYNEGYEEGKLLDTKVYVGIEPMKKIQEEAVRGFVEYLKLERKIFYAEPTLFALLEKASAEYLSSIGKDE